jgi:hypothetical protein
VIAFVVLGQILAGPVAPVAYVIPALKPDVVLKRYVTALAKVREPRVMTFDYTLDQSGARTLAQTHRVYRSGGDERDETLTVDGKRLSPPKIRIFLGRRNRYTIGALAPRLADYAFTYVGPHKNAHHFDYVFRLVPKTPRAFTVTDVTIDGVRFLPSEIAFTTGPSDGSGSIEFGVNAAWWVPYTASARASIADVIASEKLAFYTYRFPPNLPPSTFGHARDRSGTPGVGPKPGVTAIPIVPTPSLPRHRHRTAVPVVPPE